jgi:hypothetical protein
MLRQWLLGGTLAACVIAAGCSGSDNSSGSSDPAGSSAGGTSVTVNGPFTDTENTLTTDVMGLLEQATAGTPLQGALVCTDDALNHNVLDMLNSLVAGLGNPATLAKTTPAQVQSLLQELATNLGGLLNALAGKGGCGAATDTPVTNPLAGTPLSTLGAALLPVLQQIQADLQASASSGNVTTIQDLAALLTTLNNTLKAALATLPSTVTSQPVLGGVLALLGDTVNDLDITVTAFANNDTAGFQSGVQSLLTNLLDDLLTQVVPLTYLEDQAGKPGALTTTIKSAVSTLSAAVAVALGQGMSALESALSNNPLNPVLGEVNTLLTKLLNPIVAALNGLTNNDLDAVLATLGSALQALLGGSGKSCAFANIPLLSILCGV